MPLVKSNQPFSMGTGLRTSMKNSTAASVVTLATLATTFVALIGSSLTAQTSATARKVPAAPRPLMAVAHQPASASAESGAALLKTYCVGCHNDKSKAGGLTLAAFDAGAAGAKRRRRREDDSQAARRHDAAARREASRRRGPDRLRGVARNADRRGRGAAAESRLAAVPAPESGGVCARRARRAEHRRRRQLASAARHHRRTASTTSRKSRRSRRR